MKQLIFILSLSFAMLVIPCKAQVPGFVGKKFVVSGGLMFFPARNPTYNSRESISAFSSVSDALFDRPDVIGVYGMNWTKTLAVDYTIARDMTVGMSYQNMRSSDYYLVDNSPPGSGYSTYIRDIRYVYGNSIGANIKFYNETKGGLAPIGNFQKLGLSALFCRSYDSLDNIAKKAPTRNTFATFTYGFGKTIIFQKSFTFTYGMDFTFMLDRNIGVLDGNDPRIYTDAAFYRFRKMQFMNVYTSIGYIF